MPGDLRPLLIHLPAWLMVMFRLSGIFLFAPLLGSTAIFRQVKVFLIIGLSLCIYPMLLTPGRESAQMIGGFMETDLSIWGLATAIGLELLVGLVIGYAASLPLIGMQVGGQVIDQQIGMGLAGVFNPEIGEQSGMVGQFMFIVALAIFTVLGGHRILLAVLIDSFEHVPPGGFNNFESIAMLTVGLLQSAFELALRVAAPLLCLTFIQTLAMGFVARTVPQINILSIGFPLRTMMGAMMMVMFIGVAVDIYADSIAETFRQLMRFFAAA